MSKAQTKADGISAQTTYSINYPTQMMPADMTIGFWVTNIQPYLTVDEDLIQRIFEPWTFAKIESYLKRLVTGTSVTSTFIIADIQSIHDILCAECEEVMDEDVKESINENIDYFKAMLDDNKKYLLIDGKHRDDVIERVFAPKNIKSIIRFPSNAGFNSLFLDNQKNAIDVSGKAFSDLSDSLKEFILSQQISVVVITTGDIQTLQETFVTTNSGLVLYNMELRICTMSPNARYIRSLTNSDTNPEIFKFFEYFGGYSKDKDQSKRAKGDLLLLTTIASYYTNVLKKIDNPFKNFYSKEALDSLFTASKSLSKKDRAILTTAFYKLTYGALLEYKPNDKYKINISWVGFLNLAGFYLNLIMGNTPALKNRGKYVIINEGREGELLHNLEIMITNLQDRDRYIYDTKGKLIPMTKKDISGKDVAILDKKGLPKYWENEHGFLRKDRSPTVQNYKSKQEIMAIEFDKTYLSDLEALGIITLVDTQRVMSNFQKRVTAVKQNMVDAFSGKRMSFGDVTTGRTAKAHVGKYTKGNSEQVVGSSKANLHSKSDEVF
jgi:hypothetical protein